MSQLIRYDFCIAPDEQLDVVIKLAKEGRGVIHGVVLDDKGCPVKDAVVKLFEVESDKRDDCEKKCDKNEKMSCKLIPLTHAFTDECGQFLFGPLCPDRHYAVKIWVNDVCQEEKFVEVCRKGECLEFRACHECEKKERECKEFDKDDDDCGCRRKDERREKKDDCGCRDKDERKFRY